MIFLKVFSYLLVGCSLIAISMMVISAAYVLLWEIADAIKELRRIRRRKTKGGH